MIIVSIVLHGLAVAGALYAQYLEPRLQVVKNSIPVELVQLGVKRQPNLLPEKVVHEAPPPPPDDAVKLETEAPVPEATQPKPHEEKKKPELSKTAKALLDTKSPDLDEALTKIRPLEGDPSGSTQGTTTDLANAATGYQRAVMETLQRNYKLPETISSAQRQFLKAKVVLIIERDGSISHFEFTEKNSNEVFMGALNSMLSSIKLPAPPAALAGQMKNTGIEVLFHL